MLSGIIVLTNQVGKVHLARVVRVRDDQPQRALAEQATDTRHWQTRGHQRRSTIEIITTHTHSHFQKFTRAHARKRIHTHTHTHAHTHTHTHTQTRTHTHTHTNIDDDDNYYTTSLYDYL